MKILYTFINTDKLLYENLQSFSKYKKVSVDIETLGFKKEEALDPRKGKIRLIQISNIENKVLVIDLFKMSEDSKYMIKEFLEDSKRTKIFHNAKFDIKFLIMNGININNILDTMLISAVLEAGLKEPLKLESVVLRHLGIAISKEEQISNWGTETLSQDQLQYAAIDAGILVPLADVLMQEVEMNDLKETLDLELKALPAIIEMELNGIKVNTNKINMLKQDLQEKQQRLFEELQEYFGDKFNPKSPKQLKNALAVLNIDVENTGKATLSRLAPRYIEVKKLLDYREVTKQLEFANKIPAAINTCTGRLHSNYFQIGADTGRLSCTNFNLQQVPHNKLFRECFVPEEGNLFVIADYSQMQIRIAAEYSQDPLMKKIYQNGQDLHRITASVLSGKNISEVTSEERSLAKALNFGMMFGMGANSLVEYAWNNYKVELTLQQAEIFISKFYEKYVGFKTWQNEVTRENLFSSRTLLGRRRLFPDGGNYTQLINTPIQGVEGDILKTALAKLTHSLRGTSGKMIATIHDEVIVECKENDSTDITKIVKDAIEKAGQRFLKTIPIVADVSVARSWAEK